MKQVTIGTGFKQREGSRRLEFLWGMGGAALTLILGAGSVQAVGIPAGLDFFLSEPGTHFTLPPLPGGFFGSTNGTPSDPTLTQLVDGVGNPPTSLIPPPHIIFVPDPTCHVSGSAAEADCVKVPVLDFPSPSDFSTVIDRGGTILPNIGDMNTVPIEIVELHLMSVAPIEVTYGSEPSSFFDVFVDLNPNVSQTPGSLQLTRTGDHNFVTFGTMVTTLPVDFRLMFMNEDPLGPQAQFQPTGSTILGGPRSQPSGWRLVPEPSTWLLLGSGLAGLAAWRRKKLA